MSSLGDLLAGRSPATRHLDPVALEQLQNKVTIIRGRWASEPEQRQFGNDFLKSLPVQQYTHALILDADELWDPFELQVSPSSLLPSLPPSTFVRSTDASTSPAKK
jgi:hypothetical protein